MTFINLISSSCYISGQYLGTSYPVITYGGLQNGELFRISSYDFGIEATTDEWRR